MSRTGTLGRLFAMPASRRWRCTRRNWQRRHWRRRRPGARAVAPGKRWCCRCGQRSGGAHEQAFIAMHWGPESQRRASRGSKAFLSSPATPAPRPGCKPAAAGRTASAQAFGRALLVPGSKAPLALRPCAAGRSVPASTSARLQIGEHPGAAASGSGRRSSLAQSLQGALQCGTHCGSVHPRAASASCGLSPPTTGRPPEPCDAPRESCHSTYSGKSSGMPDNSLHHGHQPVHQGNRPRQGRRAIADPARRPHDLLGPGAGRPASPISRVGGFCLAMRIKGETHRGAGGLPGGRARAPAPACIRQ
jgi:hypothetical protein